MIGQTISHYRILSRLGEGGMGVVYLAEDLTLRRQVALKFLPVDLAADPEARARLIHEAQAAAALLHPHICPIHEVAESDGKAFLVMAYLEGQTLRERLREGPLVLDEALTIARQIGGALAAAHAKGIIHRDVKPANVMLTSSGAMLTDFGLAVVSGASRLTRTGSTVGTAAYLSPEQVQGADADERADVWALGAVLYEMVSGRSPFEGEHEQALFYSILNQDAAPLATKDSGFPAGLDGIVAKALAKERGKRYQKIAELVADLETLAQDRHALPAGRATKRRPRRVAPAATAAGLIAVALVAAAAWQGWWPFGPPGPAVGGSRERVLVADFVGPVGDASLARTARKIVVAAIDQSSVLITLSPEEVHEALQNAGLPDTLALTPQRARELAYRATVRTLLEGEVSRLGTSYALTLRASDVEGGRTLVTLTGTARSEDDLIPALTALARKLSSRLGKRPELRRASSEDRWNVATSSFEAYRLWADGMLLGYAGDQQGALRQYRAALALDPGFGAAWVEAGFCYANLGLRDSAVLMGEEALRHPASLAPATRLIAQGWLQAWRGDLPGAIQVYERVRRLYPGSQEARFAINNETFALMAEGRSAEALAVIDAPDAPGPAKESQDLVGFRIILLCDLGRTAEARSRLNRISPAPRPWFALGIAIAAGEWARADSIAGNLLAMSGSNSGQAREARRRLTDIGVVRGQVAAAAESLRSRSENSPLAPRWAIRGRVLLALAWGLDLPKLPAGCERDTSGTALISNAYIAAAAGDSVTARRLVVLLRATASGRYGAYGNTPEFLEAVVAARAGRWPDVVRLVAEPARLGRDRGNDRIDRIGPQHERWLVAYAYEQMQMPDSAAAFYRKLLGSDWGGAPMLWSLAHARLAVLAASAGRAGEAAHHLAVLERECTRPDAFAQRQLDQARAAVRDAVRPRL